MDSRKKALPVFYQWTSERFSARALRGDKVTFTAAVLHERTRVPPP